jgi:hypothetical protein
VEVPARLPQHGATTSVDAPAPILAPFDANCSYRLCPETAAPCSSHGNSQEDYPEHGLLALWTGRFAQPAASLPGGLPRWEGRPGTGEEADKVVTSCLA